ncbi:MAG: MFS transporter [Actinomycetota bacterium]
MTGGSGSDQPTPADQFSATDRRALASVATQFFVNGALFASVYPRLPEIRDQVGIGIEQVGLLLSVAGLAGLLGSAAVGPAVSRLGSRRVMIIFGALMALSLPVIGFATAPLVLVIGLIGLQVFDPLVDSAMNLQGSWLSGRRHTPVMSRLHGLWSLGTVIGGLAASRLAAAGVSLQVHLAGAAALLGLGLIYVGRGLLRVDEHQTSPPDAAPDAGPIDDGGAGPGDGGAAADRGSVVLALLAASGLFAVAVETVSSDWAAFRFTDDFDTPAGRAALAYVAVTTGMTIGRFAGDWAGQRLGPGRLRGVTNTLTFAGLALATLVDSPPLSLLGLFVSGIGAASMLPTIYDRAARHPGRPGAGLGALTAGLRVSGLAMPVLVGGLAATSLSVGSAMAIVTLPAVIGFAIAGRALARR